MQWFVGAACLACQLLQRTHTLPGIRALIKMLPWHICQATGWLKLERRVACQSTTVCDVPLPCEPTPDSDIPIWSLNANAAIARSCRVVEPGMLES